MQTIRDPKWAFAQALVAALIVGAIGGYVVGSLGSPPIAAALHELEKHYLVNDTSVRHIVLQPGEAWTASATGPKEFTLAYYVHVTQGSRVNAMVFTQANYDAWGQGKPFTWDDQTSAIQTFGVSRQATLSAGTIYLIVTNPSQQPTSLDVNFWPYWE